MIKKVFWILIFLYFVILVKFYVADYNIIYNIDDFTITEKATGDYIYLEVKYQDNVYNYMFETGRKLFKKRVNDVILEEVDNHVCLKPYVKSLDSYFVCSDTDGNLVSYQTLSNQDNYEQLSDNFKYYNSLKDNEHVYIWKYDGFYYMNGEDVTSINIFKKDRYSNDLMINVNDTLVFPYYDDNYLFSDFVSLNMENGKYEIIKSDYKINYDSYIVGNKKNNLYLFDNKENILYKINYKKGNVEIAGDSKKGFNKYVDGKKQEATLNDYAKDKITFFENKEDYTTISDNYFSYVLNKENRIKFFPSSDIKLVYNFNDNIYFIYKDKLYRYSDSEANLVAHYFEFNFNRNNNVFVYYE